MNNKTDLVLDIAGVIATNFSPIFWKDLSTKYEVAYDDLIMFRKAVREELWTGKIKEQEFWIRFVSRFPTIGEEYAKNKLITVIKPLLAIDEIPLWSKYANIHLLSNHRIEWVKHIIFPIQDYIKSIIISGDVGFCKPHGDIYLKVNSHLNGEKNVLFVDDQGEWIKNVSQQLLF